MLSFSCAADACWGCEHVWWVQRASR